MKKNNAIYYFLICLLFLFVFACDISTNSSEDDQISQKELDLKLTEVALQVTQTAMAAPDSSEEEQSDASPADSEEEANNGSEDEDSCNSSRMVSESIPDGTRFQAGETFTKSWTLRNAGDCDWTTDYKFVYESGDQMGGKSSMNVPSLIEPGETVTLNIDMTAPTTDGSYTGVWRLKSNDGKKMGKYWANISVGHTSTVAGGGQLPDDKQPADEQLPDDEQPADEQLPDDVQPGGEITDTLKITDVYVNGLLPDYDLFCPDSIDVFVYFEAEGEGIIEYLLKTRFGEINRSIYYDNYKSYTDKQSFEFPQGGIYPFTVIITKPESMSTIERNTHITCVK